MNFASMVDLHARGRPDAPAMIARRHTWTYDHLASLTNRFAYLLDGSGVEATDRVGFYTPNVPEYAVGYIGALKHGSIPVPINKRLDREALRHVLDDVAPETVLTTVGLADRLPQSTPNPMIFDPTGEESHTVRTLLDAHEPTFNIVPRQNGDIASIMYTSGSTGRPKGVVHQHGTNSPIQPAVSSSWDSATRMSPMWSRRSSH